MAYGSNLHPHRLALRVPSARPIGVVSLANKQLAFLKRGEDGSSKCSIVSSKESAHTVFAAVYNIAAEEKPQLDRVEGLGNGYNEEVLTVELAGRSLDTFVYIADSAFLETSLAPYEWYKEMVVLGAKYHSFPEDYVSQIQTVRANPDLDASRNAVNTEILAAMRAHNHELELT